MFYVLEELNWRRCRHNTVPLSHIMSTVSDSVILSPKGGGGRSRFGPSFSVLPFFPFSLRFPFHYKEAPLEPARRSGKRCKLPQWGQSENEFGAL